MCTVDMLTHWSSGHVKIMLQGLLDNLQDMDLVQVEHVMDLLCRLVYAGDVDSLHQDEIHMMIRKHLSSSSDMYVLFHCLLCK
jgi:hypothetical protein